VQVHCGEGVAIHTGPKPCVDTREGAGEASAGESTGQPLSRERVCFPDADAVNWAEGNTRRCASASACGVRRGRRPWHVQTLLAREPGDLVPDQRRVSTALARTGKARSRSR
jgi:hypothetical protein